MQAAGVLSKDDEEFLTRHVEEAANLMTRRQQDAKAAVVALQHLSTEQLEGRVVLQEVSSVTLQRLQKFERALSLHGLNISPTEARRRKTALFNASEQLGVSFGQEVTNEF